MVAHGRGRQLKTTVDQTLIRGLATAGPCFVSGLQAFQEESNRLAKASVDARAGLEGRIAEAERKIAAIIRAIEEGRLQPSLTARLATLEAEKAKATAELADLPEATPVVLHPNLPALYRRKVEELERLLADPELAQEAMAAIQALISRIALTPRAEGGMAADLHGDLAQILLICEGAERKNARLGGGRSADVPMSRVSVVAGARNTLNLLFWARCATW